MITFLLVGAGIIVLVGIFVMVMRSGNASGRHGQSSGEVVRMQEHSRTTPTKDLRGSVRSDGDSDT